MICLHDDIAEGKDEPAGLGSRASMRYADELAKRGYVCLVPDYPSFGENRYDFHKNAGKYASLSMKAVWDNIRSIDLLETMPEVSTKRNASTIAAIPSAATAMRGNLLRARWSSRKWPRRSSSTRDLPWRIT